MASAFASGNRVAWQYTDDNGADWVISAKSVYVLGADAADYGGSAPASTVARIPKQLKPRRVKCVSAGAADRWPIVYETDAALWTTPGTSITLNLLGVDTVYTSTRVKRAERNPDGIRQTS